MSALHVISSPTGLLGYVVIDSTVAGRARGGLRIVPDLSVAEIEAAARSMTLKYGLVGLPQGGAKGGVLGNPDAGPTERESLLRAFAEAARALLLTRQYIPDADLGTTAAEIRAMMRGIGVRVGPREWRQGLSGEHTARSCLAAAEALLDVSGRTLVGCRVAVEGFGKVGGALARLLVARGARVVAISTSAGAVYEPGGLDVARLLGRAAVLGSEFVHDEPGQIDRGALLTLPVDLLCPCARFHSVHEGNAGRIQARAIVAGANDPVSPAAERVLSGRGIVVLPAFVSNCGGVLGGTLEFAGVRAERVGAIIEAPVRRAVRDLLLRAARTGQPLAALAEADALARHAAVSRQAARPRLVDRLVAGGVAAYHRGWIPRVVMSRAATRFVLRGLA